MVRWPELIVGAITRHRLRQPVAPGLEASGRAWGGFVSLNAAEELGNLAGNGTVAAHALTDLPTVREAAQRVSNRLDALPSPYRL